MKKYKLINNTLGWLMFLVAAVTYLLTIEPTASFWDCPEFIAQGFKSEIGHPPGNPIFILVARFATLFAGGDVTLVSKCVNAMSALLSAATILLLFWTITHLVKKLLIENGKEDQMTLAQYLIIMGSGVCGALAYTWSDTFWFSAVEAEVYAFSSFCTALVFWLILKWEDQADEPGSDRWLILIAYIVGVSLGVHLLNLLCIPAIALVFYYRKFQNTNAKGSLITLAVSFVIIVLVLYGLEPGFVKMGQNFDLLAVNTLGMSFNMGVLIYAILFVAVLAWNIYEFYTRRSELRMKVSFMLAVLLSGMLLIGEGWKGVLVDLAMLAGLVWYLFFSRKKLPVRILSNISLSILVIFIGFSSYALILIRSNANTPLDENSPNNTFALAKYLSREQYGETPLLYGRTFNSGVVYRVGGNGTMKPLVDEGSMQYAQQVKTSPDEPDHYVEMGPKQNYRYSPEQNMLFPRIHSEAHAQQYAEWLGDFGTQVNATVAVDDNGDVLQSEAAIKPTMLDNLRWFIGYQLNYMYWRYFMWNFAGRQNDIQGMGEITQGNWISGIPFIDNPRLGDQSLLPDDYGKGNKGHNVFFLLPLLLGIVGLLWQAYRGKRGIEQFWVVFFLFFMTGIAIVLYLNQTPNQPRERDYAYAGSFYAYAIWIGIGVAGLWRMVLALMAKKDKKSGEREELGHTSKGLAMAGVAALIGLAVPLQMVSQTWDDHDRSGRYAARDFGMNYLSSVDQNGIIFTNGDNDTFPLWYLQEVEGYRTDVRVVNLSYLSTDWYIAQMKRAAYDSKPLPMQATNLTYAYDNRQYNYLISDEIDTTVAVPVSKCIEQVYGPDHKKNRYGMSAIKYPRVFIPINGDQAVKAGVVPADRRDMVQESINLNLQSTGSGLTSSQLMSLDIINSSILDGWKRPCYFAMTVPESYYLGLTPYLRNTGMAYQVTPLYGLGAEHDIQSATDKMYDIVMNKFRWGGIDVAKPGKLYLDETVRRMVTTTRSALVTLANDLIYEGVTAQQSTGENFLGKDAKTYAKDRFDRARKVLDLLTTKLPTDNAPYAVQMGERIALAYANLKEYAGDKAAGDKAAKLLEKEVLRFADYVRFYQTLSAVDYDRLTRYDKFIDMRYFPLLLQDYSEVNQAGFDALVKKVQAKGVNMERTMEFMKPQQTAAPVQLPMGNDTTSELGG